MKMSPSPARDRTRRLSLAGLAMVLSLGAGLVLNVAANIFSALSHRPLHHDGAYHFYVILRDGDFNWSGRMLDRIFASFWQFPTVFLVNLADGRDWLRAELLTFELTCSLHPFLSLALAAWICKRARVPWMFIFPLASYAMASSLTQGYAVGEIGIALSLFWPLFLVVLLRPFKPMVNRPFIALFGGTLVGVHSWAFFLFLALIPPTLIKSGVRLRKLPAEAWVQAGVFLAAGAWLLYMGAIMNRVPHLHPFLYGFTQPWGEFLKIALPGALAFTVLAFWGGPADSLARRDCWGALWILTVITCCFWAWGLTAKPFESRGSITSFYGRIPAIPIACWIALALFVIDRRVPRSAWASDTRWRLALAPLLLLLFLGGLNTISQVLYWRESLQHLQTAMANDPRPCIVLSKKDFDAWFFSRGNWALSLPALSMVIQGTNAPTQIVAHEMFEKQAIKRDFCSRIANGIVPWVQGDDDLSQGRHFLTLDRIRERMKRGP